MNWKSLYTSKRLGAESRYETEKLTSSEMPICVIMTDLSSLRPSEKCKIKPKFSSTRAHFCA